MAWRFGELISSFLLLSSEFPSAWRRKCNSNLHRQSAPAPGSPAPCFFPGRTAWEWEGRSRKCPIFSQASFLLLHQKWSLHAKPDFISCSLGSKPSQCWSLGFGSFLPKVKGKEFFILKSVTLRVSKAFSNQCLRDRDPANFGSDPKLFQCGIGIVFQLSPKPPVACSDSS